MLLKEVLKTKGVKQKWPAGKLGVSEVTLEMPEHFPVAATIDPDLPSASAPETEAAPTIAGQTIVA